MRRSRTPQRLRELRAEVSVRTAAAARTVCKTGRSLAAQVRNCNREQIRCVEVDADGVERARTFTLHKQIGEGSYSTVLKVCEWQPDGRPQVYAMKRILAQDAAARRRVAGEVELMLQLPPHPNILGLVAYSSAETGAGGILAQLVLEMCYHGSVVHYLLERGGEPFSLPQVYRLFLDMASGLLHLHAQSPPIAHRDFKLENVLLAPDGFAKLCDFGSATCRSGAYAGKAAIDSAEDELHRLSTAQYRPPESFDLHRGQPLSEKADVWALGVAFFKLACNKDPAPPGEERLGALNAAWRQRLPEPGARGSLGRHRAPDGVSRELLELALQQDPARRPSVRELLQWLRAQAPPGLPSVSSVGLLYAPGVLTVRLGGARDLLSKGGVGGEPLCYARVSCEGAVRQTADAPWPHPVWRARFSFRAHSLSKVLVAVWQRQPGGVADEFLGQLSVSLSRQAQLLAAAGTAGADEGPGWRALQRRSDRSRVQGSAQVLLEFAPGRAEREGWEAWSDAIDGGNGGAARAPSARWAERGADGGSSTLAGGGASASSLAEGGSSSSSGAQELIDFGEQQHDRQRAPQRGRPPLAADHSVGQALSAPPPSALDREAGGPADPFGLAALEREGSSERDLIAWEATEWDGALAQPQSQPQPQSPESLLDGAAASEPLELVADPLASPPGLPPSLLGASDLLGSMEPLRPDLMGSLQSLPADLLGSLEPMSAQPPQQPQQQAQGGRPSVQAAMLDAYAPPMLPTQPQQAQPWQAQQQWPPSRGPHEPQFAPSLVQQGVSGRAQPRPQVGAQRPLAPAPPRPAARGAGQFWDMSV